MRTRNTAAAAQHMRLDYVQSVTKMGNYTNTCTCACTACGGVYVCETCTCTCASWHEHDIRHAGAQEGRKSGPQNTYMQVCTRAHTLSTLRASPATFWQRRSCVSVYARSHVDCSWSEREASNARSCRLLIESERGGGRREAVVGDLGGRGRSEGGGGRREVEGGAGRIRGCSGESIKLSARHRRWSHLPRRKRTRPSTRPPMSRLFTVRRVTSYP